jgi:hypothetical protein
VRRFRSEIELVKVHSRLLNLDAKT